MRVLTPLQSTSTDVQNFLGVILILSYFAAYYLRKNADSTYEEQLWRKRSLGILFGFAVYAVGINTFGSQTTWVATAGEGINRIIREFTEKTFKQKSPTEAKTNIDQVQMSVKNIGLASYVVVFGILSFSGRAVSRIGNFVRNLF